MSNDELVQFVGQFIEVAGLARKTEPDFASGYVFGGSVDGTRIDLLQVLRAYKKE